MSYPKTDVEWWTLVNKNWANLFDIMWMYIPMDGHEDRDGTILVGTLAEHVTRLKEEQDPDLSRYFSATWASAPDSRGIHSIPGWGVLCDLCSESYVLYDNEEAK